MNTEKGLGLGCETSQQSQVSLSNAEVVGLRLLRHYIPYLNPES